MRTIGRGSPDQRSRRICIEVPCRQAGPTRATERWSVEPVLDRDEESEHGRRLAQRRREKVVRIASIRSA